MGERPTGTVTFLFTDIEGSTPLWDAHPAAMRVALARHDEIIQKAIHAAGGHIFSTGGDGFGAAFERAGNAVVAALGAQLDLAAEPWATEVELKVRMGVHTGEVHERDGDYFGPPVNRAARLMGAAHGGQVVVSDVTAALVDPAAAGVELVDLGEVHLKGLVDPVHVFGLAAEGHPWLDRPLVSTHIGVGNLPRPHTEAVGDLVDLQERVASLGQNRLVTLTGAGGVGKTRAAIEIGWLVVDEFPDGVWLVELGPITEPDLVVSAVASAIGVQPQPGMALDASLVDWCQGRRVLLLLDNCEHVLEPVNDLVEAVVSACPTTTVLATSREPLGIAGEQVVRVPSLALAHGVELFRVRAAAAGADLSAAADDSAIEAICTRLDGIPLAIELAAARTRSLSPDDLLERLDDRFRLLRGGGRGMERHQTLRAAVSWSYDLLDDRQQLLFDRLSVFPGDFDLRAAEATCADDELDELDELDIIDLLGELVDKSMVVAEREGTTLRYRILETLRQFGEESLDRRGETAARRDRHLEHYRDLAGDLASRWRGPDRVEIERVVALEWDNLRAAHGWALTCRRLVEATDLLDPVAEQAVFHLRHEMAGWVDRTLALADELGVVEPRAALAGAMWAFHLAQPERCLALVDQVIEAGADRTTTAMATALRVDAKAAVGDEIADALADARALLETADDPVERYTLARAVMDVRLPDEPGGIELLDIVFDAAHEIASPGELAEAHRMAGNLAIFSSGDPLAGIEHYRTAIDLAQTVGAKLTVAWSLGGIGALSTHAGLPDAPRRVAESLRYANELHYPLIIETGLAFDARYLAGEGRSEVAALVLGYGERRPSPFRVSALWLEQTRASLADHPELDELVARGARMSRADVVAAVLETLDDL